MFADPFLRPFGCNEDKELGADVMPIGEYLMASNEVQYCRNTFDNRFPVKFAVIAEVGAPYFFGRVGYGYTPNRARLELPEHGLKIIIDKNYNAFAQENNGQMQSVNVPYAKTIGGGYSIRLERTADDYLTLTSNFGISVAFRGWAWQQDRWGRFKLEIDEFQREGICGLCTLNCQTQRNRSRSGIASVNAFEVNPWRIGSERFR